MKLLRAGWNEGSRSTSRREVDRSTLTGSTISTSTPVNWDSVASYLSRRGVKRGRRSSPRSSTFHGPESVPHQLAMVSSEELGLDIKLGKDLQVTLLPFSPVRRLTRFTSRTVVHVCGRSIQLDPIG